MGGGGLYCSNVTAILAGMAAEDFEKDDDTNFHMDFIGGVGNLRARNYYIEEVSSGCVLDRLLP